MKIPNSTLFILYCSSRYSLLDSKNLQIAAAFACFLFIFMKALAFYPMVDWVKHWDYYFGFVSWTNFTLTLDDRLNTSKYQNKDSFEVAVIRKANLKAAWVFIINLKYNFFLNLNDVINFIMKFTLNKLIYDSKK